MQGFHRKLAADLKTINPTVEVQADTRRAVRDITDIGRRSPTVDVQVRVDKAAAQRALREVEQAESSLTNARANSADASKKVDIAEKALSETRSKSGENSSKAAAAELKLSQAHRAAASAVNDVRNAEVKLSASRKNQNDVNKPGIFGIGNGSSGSGGGIAGGAGAAVKFLSSMADEIGGVIKGFAQLGEVASDAGGSAAKGASQGAAAVGNLAGAAEAAGGPIVALVAAGASIAVIGTVGTVAAASLIGIADAAVTAAGAVFLVPAGLAIAGGAIGTLFIGTMGLSDAFDALGKSQANSAKDGQAAAKAQRSAAEQVGAAEQSLSRAQEDAATSRENSARQVADAVEQERRAEVDAARDEVQAKRQVIDAEKQLNQARDDLTQATEDAVKAQRDLNLQLRGGALDAQEAALDLVDAQTELNDAQKQGVGGEELQRLQIAYQRAKLRVDETTASNKDLTEQQDEYAKKGVKANDAVVSATEAVQRAEQGLSDARDQADYTRQQSAQRVGDAVKAVADAERSRDQAALQATRSIADAEKALDQAHQNAADSLSQLSTSEQAVADAMGALSPNAQKFVDTVWGLKPAFDAVKKSVQDALFAGMDEQIKKLSDVYMPILKDRLTGISDAAHDAAIDIVDLLTDPGNAGQVNKILQTTEDIVRDISKVMGPLIEAFLDLADVGADVFKEDVLPALEDAAGGFRDWIKEMKDSGQLKDWMSGAVDVLKGVFDWSIKLAGAFLSILGSLSAGVKQSGFFDTLGDTIQKFIDFANSERGQEFFFELGVAIGVMAKMIVWALGLVIDFIDGIQWVIDFFKNIFTLDFEGLKKNYGDGVGSILEAVRTAVFGGGVFGLFEKIFDLDWPKIWDWFRGGVGQVLTTIFSSIIPAPVKTLLEGMFHLDWDSIIKFIIGGLNRTLGAIGKFVRDNPLGKFLTGLFGESSPAINNPGLFLPGFANPFGRADGGMITGPGGPRDDAVPLWGSNGEFVVNAAATAKNRGLLEWINAGKFANGGLIGGGTASKVAGGNTSLTIDVGALANLGDVAETVTGLVADLNAQLAELVADTAAYWLQLVTSITTADNAISARQTLLQQQTAFAWATMQTTVWASTNGQLTAINALTTGLAQLRAAMTNTADWAVLQFGRVSAAAADPIRWVLQFPFNQGLITAWNQLDADFALGKHVNPVPVAFASGGPVFGPGSGTSDDIFAKLSNGEFVIREAVTRRVRPFLDALNAGQPEALEAAGVRRYATGGAVTADTGSQLNATVFRGQQFLRAQAGKPYVWGGVGPYGYDCSGLVSAVTNVLRGESNPYRRLGVAASQPWAGFVPGLSSAFASGFNSHHTALTLGGLNGEAQTFGVPVLVGGRASGADSSQFTGRASLPVVGGQFVSGGGPGADPAAMLAAAFAKTLEQTDTIDQMWPGNHAAAAGEGMMRQAVASLTKYGVDRLNSMLTVTGVAGSPEVIAAVRAVARSFGWGDGTEWADLQQLVSHESGFNPNAANPTSSARGLFQKLTSVNGPIEPDVAGQTRWGLNYIKGRYGSPSAAWAAWQSRSPHWYDDGGIANGIGFMPKNTLEPERVLSPAQTRAFESAMAQLGRDGYATPFREQSRESVVVHQTINPGPGMDETATGRAAGRYVVSELRRS